MGIVAWSGGEMSRAARTGHLIPPANFGLVEEDVYRCGQPYALNFPFIERLRLHTIIYLAPDDPSPQFLSFIDDQGIELHHITAEERGHGPWNQLSEEVVLTACHLMLDAKD